jgi:hypothetical protein
VVDAASFVTTRHASVLSTFTRRLQASRSHQQHQQHHPNASPREPLRALVEANEPDLSVLVVITMVE